MLKVNITNNLSKESIFRQKLLRPNSSRTARSTQFLSDTPPSNYHNFTSGQEDWTEEINFLQNENNQNHFLFPLQSAYKIMILLRCRLLI